MEHMKRNLNILLHPFQYRSWMRACKALFPTL